MTDLETKIRNAVKRGYSDIRLIGMNITDEVLSAISEIWMNCKTITSIDLSGNKITTLKNIVFPPCVERLFFGYNSITALDGFVIPNGLWILWLVFLYLSVSELTVHSLDNNRITALGGFVIPDGLEYLELVFFI